MNIDMSKAIIILTLVIFPISVISKDYFTAAVFEHRLRASITDEKSPTEIKSANLKFYVKAAEIAAQNKADIIVFPEYGVVPYPGNRENMKTLAEHVPDPQKTKVNPCLQNNRDKFILWSMSCLARNHHMYIVINLLDIQECETQCDSQKLDACDTKCPDDGFLAYNTDVAFDREGNIVARYHKMHPYFELVNTPEEAELITFDTEFGRFGMVVCFDAVFEESYKLKKDYNIDTLIYPTYWFDDIESLNSVQFQQAWALANNVNFLASNAHNATTGTLGSGIYSKDMGALIYTYDNDGDSKLLLANVRIKDNAEVPQLNSIFVVRDDEIFVKKEETGENFATHCYKEFVGPANDMEHDYRCFKYQTENFTHVKLEAPSGTIESCNNGFCCTLTYHTKGLEDTWFLAALNGTNNVKNYYHWWEETCLLVRCDPFNNKECVMLPSTSETIFTNLELKAKFTADTIYPTVSKINYRLAPKHEWNFATKGSDTVLTYKSNSETPLLKVALLGRNFSRDPPFVPWYKYSMPETFFM